MPMPDAAARESARRLRKLQQALKKRRLDALLIFDRSNTYYLTGKRCSLSYLFVTPREAVLYVDGRYIEATREEVRHVDVRLMKNQPQTFGRWQKEFKPSRIGFEGATPWRLVQQWREQMPGLEWIEAGELVERLRLVKSTAEIKLIEQSARLTDRIYETALESIAAGATEWDLRNVIRAEADRLGCEGLSFDCIVASGAMGSRPHYEPQARRLERGDLLLIDLGVIKEAYCSDMTRVVGLGRKPKPRLMRAYEAVLEAQAAALEAVEPGVSCAEIDRIARDHLKSSKFGRYFTHGLGHGVGLEIHEAPTLNPRSQDILKAGMVITIEPGVYLPGLGGIRIEDLVAVTRKGSKVLSRAPKDFRLIPFEK